MNIWETVTGSDLTREWKRFEARAEKLPPEFRAAWLEVVSNLFPYGNFSGRNLMPILDGVLTLLEESAGDGQTIGEVLGDDIPGFCAAVAGGEAAPTFRDRWRRQLNDTVARKLSRLGE